MVYELHLVFQKHLREAFELVFVLSQLEIFHQWVNIGHKFGRKVKPWAHIFNQGSWAASLWVSVFIPLTPLVLYSHTWGLAYWPQHRLTNVLLWRLDSHKNNSLWHQRILLVVFLSVSLMVCENNHLITTMSILGMTNLTHLDSVTGMLSSFC